MKGEIINLVDFVESHFLIVTHQINIKENRMCNPEATLDTRHRTKTNKTI